MKLWLDDIRPMPESFDVHVRTAQEAIDLIKTKKVKFISFDHDLGPEEAGTGYLVAAFIEAAAFNKKIEPIEWFVHSANPVGEKNIRMAMTAAERFWK